MSPTSLANHRPSGTLKSRTLLHNAPWHRRLFRRLTSSPSSTQAGDPVASWSLATSASKAAIAKGRDRLVQFVPSQQERNKITLHYHDGGEPLAFVFPPPVIPRLKSPRPWNEWTELA